MRENKNKTMRLCKTTLVIAARYCHTSKCPSLRRKYVSRMLLNSLGKQKEGQCKSLDLFLQNEILYPCHKGSFYYLPMALRSLEKLTRLIDEEMQDIGAQKISMPTVILGHLWKQTGRWDTKELFKLKDRNSTDYCLGPTHEELVTDLVAKFSKISYKRLPILLYQITRKFRDEMAPKHGLLRGREFEMKDLYTFDTDEKTARETYKIVCDAYCRIFTRLGLKFQKVEAATGNIGGKMSDEFHLVSDAGEDVILVCDQCGHGVNTELVGMLFSCYCPSEDESKTDATTVKCSKCQSSMRRQPAIEVGHAFLLGDKYSKVFNASYEGQEGQQITEMGCFGLGVSRILQASVEVLQEDGKIRWPALIAPYQICIIPQMKGYGSETFNTLAESINDHLCSMSHLRNEVVIDDRTHLTIGRRIQEADRQGYPQIIVVGKKSLEETPLLEVMDVSQNTKDFLTVEQIVEKYSSLQTLP